MGVINILEYCLQGITDRDSVMMFDEAGNCYVSSKFIGSSEILMGLQKIFFQDMEYTEWSLVTADRYKELLKYEIIVDEGVKEYDTYVRRPYYRMRGKKVTEEQAFDIIRRVDNFFQFYTDAIQEHIDYIGSLNFDNWIFDKHHYPYQYGWVHVDGTIGCNAITQKHPNIDEFISEWFAKMMAFPYLDLVIAITDWNELPPYAWETFLDSNYPYEKENFPDFLEYIDCGIWVHDKVLEIMEPRRTVKKYAEYVKLYDDKNKDMYLSHYYNDNGIVQADMGYLKKCIEAYGLNADEELGKLNMDAYKMFVLC